jgi:hypothetical protein
MPSGQAVPICASTQTVRVRTYGFRKAIFEEDQASAFVTGTARFRKIDARSQSVAFNAALLPTTTATPAQFLVNLFRLAGRAEPRVKRL